MPGPAVYVGIVVGSLATVAAVIAFKEFVYEPHIAPKLEAWAQSYLENRRQRRRHRAAPHSLNIADDEDENSARRSGDPFADPRRSDDAGSDDESGAMSVELEQLVLQERNSWRLNNATNSQLRQRRRNGVMDESTPFVPYSPLSPTHVIFDESVPISPTTASERFSEAGSPRPSRQPSAPNSPQVSRQSSLRSPPSAAAHPLMASRSPPPPEHSPRLPTPVSNYSPSPRVQTPAMSSRGSPATLRMSSHVSTPAMSEVNIPPSMYNTAQDVSVQHLARGVSPFSDALSSSTLSSGMASPDVHSPVMSISDLDMPSDDEFDVLSPRSAMFSPPASNLSVDQTPQQAYLGLGTLHAGHAALREDPLEVRSQHGSEGSWASVGRRTPEM